MPNKTIPLAEAPIYSDETRMEILENKIAKRASRKEPYLADKTAEGCETLPPANPVLRDAAYISEIINGLELDGEYVIDVNDKKDSTSLKEIINLISKSAGKYTALDTGTEYTISERVKEASDVLRKELRGIPFSQIGSPLWKLAENWLWVLNSNSYIITEKGANRTMWEADFKKYVKEIINATEDILDEKKRDLMLKDIIKERKTHKEYTQSLEKAQPEGQELL